jgi:Helix-turn-helix domain
VTGLRREEVSLLAGVSIGYYVRMYAGTSLAPRTPSWKASARALQLDDAERDHLFDLARASEPRPRR